MGGRRASPASDQAYRAIRTAILEGRYSGGSRLTEDQLAADLGLSRTPVREAVRRLETEMLLRSVPRVGLVVPLPTLEEFYELFEARLMVDTYAARLAAERATPGQLRTLRFTHERLGEAAAAGAAGDLIRGNIRFHAQVIEATHNRRLLSMSRPLVDAIEVAAARVRLARAQEMLIEHAAIVEALEGHDPGRAEDAARLHVEHGQAFYARLIGEASMAADAVFSKGAA